MEPAKNPTTSTSHGEAPSGQSSESATLAAVILAGRLRRLPIQESLNLHPLCLPVGHRGTLLETWLAALGSVPKLTHTRVVVNTEDDASAVRGVLPREVKVRTLTHEFEVMAEPASWRGAGGIVRDVTDGLSEHAIVLVCEGTRLPPRSLSPLFDAIQASNTETGEPPLGVVGVVGEDTPAGVYVFRRKAIALAPRVGYFDLKEQLLPALVRKGHRVMMAQVDADAPRLRDRETYLQAVRCNLMNGHMPHSGNDNGVGSASPLRVSARASVSGSAVLDGFCIIEPGAVIEDGAVVHESVVLWGATVGGGAIVSRSVVGPLANVEPRTRVLREIVSHR